jgi:TfoX N-terminal domain
VAYDEGLAERIRDQVAGDLLMSERKMFGGLCFMSGGNMCFGVIGTDLLVRVGPESYAASLDLPHVREMDLTGRPLRGMVLVDSEGLSEDDSLREWLDRGLDFTDTLPPK